MKKVKIFLASSSELKEDRRLFEMEIYRKCKVWIDMGIFLHLDIWEDLSARMSNKGHSQADYNEVIKQSDILILLAYTKVGMYTAEEFEAAYGLFQKTEKPFIFIYFKDGAINTGSTTPEMSTLLNFKKRISDLGHFPGNCNDFNDLWNQFNKELDRLERNGFSEIPDKQDQQKKGDMQSLKTKMINITGDNKSFLDINSNINDNSLNQTHSGNGDNVGRDKITGK